MTIYLLSNLINKKAEEVIYSLNIKNEDIIVVFNHAAPMQYKKIHDHKKKFLFLRKGEYNQYGYHGDKKALQDKHKYEKIILINRSLKSEKFFKKIDATEIINGKTFVTTYTKNKIPTSGFISFMYMKNKFPETKINLINFTCSSSTGQRKYKNHDYSFEQNFYKQHKVIMLS